MSTKKATKGSKKGLLIIVAAVVVVLGLVGAGVYFVLNSAPKGIQVAVSTLPDSLNPVLEQNTSGLNADELLFDGLCNFEVDETSGRLYTDFALAESIEQDPKTKVDYTVILRADALWHDGNPVTADDVVYSFQAYTNEENNSPKRDYIMSFIESVDAVDAATVHIKFVNPLPEFRAYPVLAGFKIIPSRYNGQDMDVNMRAGENERKFATAPIGTGPFKLATWELGKWLTFESNLAYFKQVPAAESLVIKRTIDPVVRMNEMRRGRTNFILETNPMDRKTVSQMKGVDIQSYLPYAFYQVAINFDHFPRKDGRKAMAMALNKEKLIPGITDQDKGIIINNGPFPSNLYSSNIPEYRDEPMDNLLPYDLATAKELAEKNGISGQSTILIYPDSMGEFGTQLAEGIAKQLSAIGLNVETKRTGDQVYNRMVYKEKSYELALMYCEGFDNVYSSIGDWYTSKGQFNVTGLADKDLDKLLDNWSKVVETTEWIKLTDQVNEKISDLSPNLFLCSLEKDVYSRGLSNVAIATDNPFLSVEYWKFGK